MALNGTIQSVEQHLKNCWQKIEDKGGDLPAQLNLANLAQAIEDLPSGPIGYGTYGELQKAIRNGTAQKRFPIGTELPTIFNNVEIPGIIAQYEAVTDKIGGEHAGAYIVAKYATADAIYDLGAGNYGNSALKNIIDGLVDRCTDEVMSVLQEVQIKCVTVGTNPAPTLPVTVKLFAPSVSQLVGVNRPSRCWVSAHRKAVPPRLITPQLAG